MIIIDSIRNWDRKRILSKLTSGSAQYDYRVLLLDAFLEPSENANDLVVAQLTGLANRRTVKGHLFSDKYKGRKTLSFVYERMFPGTYGSMSFSLHSRWNNELHPTEPRDIEEFLQSPYSEVQYKCKHIQEEYLAFLEKFYDNKETREITEKDIRPIVEPLLTLD